MSVIKDFITIYNIGEEWCEPAHSFGPAVRDHYLLHMVAEGQGTYTIDGKQYKVQGGEGFLIPPDLITYYEADKREPWHYLWIGFMGICAPDIVRQCGISRKNPIFKVTDAALGAQHIRAARGCTVSEEDEFMLLSSFYGFMALIRGEEYSARGETGVATSIRKYIEKNYSYRMSVTELADMFSISRSQMFRIFKAEYGVSVKDYIVDYRLMQAAGLMAREDMSISEIMYSCGFNDLPYFSKRFKEKYSSSPTIYRRGLEDISRQRDQT